MGKDKRGADASELLMVNRKQGVSQCAGASAFTTHHAGTAWATWACTEILEGLHVLMCTARIYL